MIVQFDNKDLEDLYEGKTNRNTKKIDLLLTRKFIKTVKLLSYIENVQKLSQHDGLNFEILKGAYKGKYSVRIAIENDRILLDRILIIEELTDHYKRMI